MEEIIKICGIIVILELELVLMILHDIKKLLEELKKGKNDKTM